MKFSAIFTIMIVFASVALLSFMQPPAQKKGEPWNIPAEFKSKSNPHAGDESLLRLGRNGYTRHCRSCHGRIGQGDGPMANQLKTFAGDFTKKEWQEKYNDGEIYYMSFIGRDEMPNFESLIPDEEERWAIVNFIRTLKQ
jgi:mono/diheme cytochrome c family protein